MTKAPRLHMEAIRWPNDPFCPHCGSVSVYRMQGKSHRQGLLGCRDCRGHFTVTNGSVMERSHIPLAKWVLAFHLMAASKKGVSAHQLHRMLHVTYKAAWFMAHRIREAMTDANPVPLGGDRRSSKAMRRITASAKSRCLPASNVRPSLHQRRQVWRRPRGASHLQARHDRHLPALRRTAPTTLS